MALTTTQIKDRIQKLEDLLDSGATNVTIDGVATNFRTQSEINGRIWQLKQELQERNGETITGIYKNVSMANGGSL